MGFYYTNCYLIDALSTEETIHLLLLFVLSGRPIDRCPLLVVVLNGLLEKWTDGVAYISLRRKVDVNELIHPSIHP